MSSKTEHSPTPWALSSYTLCLIIFTTLAHYRHKYPWLLPLSSFTNFYAHKPCTLVVHMEPCGGGVCTCTCVSACTCVYKCSCKWSLKKCEYLYCGENTCHLKRNGFCLTHHPTLQLHCVHVHVCTCTST